MATPPSGAFPVARSEPRTRTALLLEAIALRHQIAVLERSQTWRPCFRRIDRLLWIFLSRWWPQWRESLVVVQPETVLRWRRDGSMIWRYRARGRWRGGRPRVSSEVRHLIARMLARTFSGERHGAMARFACSVSESLKPPCRATCRHRADGQHSRGGPFFAMRPSPSAAASIRRSGPTRSPWAGGFGPIAAVSCDLWRRLRRHVLGSAKALAADSRP
jgi:hypothetical protein